MQARLYSYTQPQLTILYDRFLSSSSQETATEYSRKQLTLALALVFAMAAAGVQVATAQDSPADYINPHNAARAAVGLGSVTWDPTVAAYAQSYAEQRRGDCALLHSSGGPYGENIFRGTGSSWSAADAVKLWVDEKQNYDHGSNSCVSGKMCGHYTQVVWTSSTAIGCARVVCDNGGGVFITCNYSPPGNVVGQSPY